MTYEGKVVVVTGGASGIGRAMVEAFLHTGATVVAIDRDRDGLNRLEAAAAGNPATGELLTRVGDVADEQNVNILMAELLTELDSIDVLCNNAGILGDNTRLHDLQLNEWRRVMSVNLDGVFLMSRAALPGMLDRASGAIINTASIASFVGGGGNSAYTASKAGVAGLTRQMAYEYARQGVRINAIAPGAIETGLADHIKTGGEHTELLREHRITTVPARRIGQPREIASLAVFLGSERASFIHGAVYNVDGGFLAG